MGKNNSPNLASPIYPCSTISSGNGIRSLKAKKLMFFLWTDNERCNFSTSMIASIVFLESDFGEKSENRFHKSKKILKPQESTLYRRGMWQLKPLYQKNPGTRWLCKFLLVVILAFLINFSRLSSSDLWNRELFGKSAVSCFSCIKVDSCVCNKYLYVGVRNSKTTKKHVSCK